MPTARKPKPGGKLAPPHTMSVADAKAHFSSVISGVHKKRTPVTILKRGIPVAEIIPIADEEPASGFGWMRGTVQVLGDIVGPTGVEWTLKEVEEGHE